MQGCMSKWSFSHHWVVRKKPQQEDYCGCQSVTRFKLLLSHTIQIAVLKITLWENFLELIFWENAGYFQVPLKFSLPNGFPTRIVRTPINIRLSSYPLLWCKRHIRHTADLITFTEEILNGKLHVLCSASTFIYLPWVELAKF